jgi:hypothetical protein
MRQQLVPLLMAACILVTGSRCHGQTPEPVLESIARALINFRSDDVTQSTTGMMQLHLLVDSGRIDLRHGEGRQLIDSLFTIAATDERWSISGVARRTLEYLDSVAGAPRLIDDARWMGLYAVLRHSSGRTAILRRFNDRYAGPEGIAILGQLAVLSQNHTGDLERVVEIMFDRGPAGDAELIRLLDEGAFTDPDSRERLRRMLQLDDG